ncbi:oligosaccharide flippase family protein [Flavobacterium sp. W1B]|uniref:oligosaccharide flippase family protein n=1 Tax=Flavobacterium sp. W1B TaxID=3394146 RepID=UPI0039BC673D
MIKKIKSAIKKIYKPELLSAIKWSFIGQIITRLLNICSTIFMARLMLPPGYGVYSYIIGTLVFFSTIVGLSIRTTSTRNIAVLLKSDKVSFEKYVKVTLVTGNVLGILGMILAITFLLISKDNHVVNLLGFKTLLFSSVAIYTEIFYGLILGILGGVTQFKLINILTILSSLFKFLVSYFMFLQWGLRGAIIGWVFVSLLFVVIAMPILKRSIRNLVSFPLRYSYSDCKKELKLFLEITLPISIEAGSLLLSMWFIQTLFLNNEETGKYELAIFNVANQWKGMALYVPAILINLLQPFFSSFQNVEENSEMKTLFLNTRKLVLIISILITIFLCLFSNTIIDFFGKGYEGAKEVLLILIFPTVIIGVSNLYRELYISKGKVWIIALNNIVIAIFITLLFLYLRNLFSLSFAYSIAAGLGEFLLLFLYVLTFKKAKIF